jgi:hypothetical protein
LGSGGLHQVKIRKASAAPQGEAGLFRHCVSTPNEENIMTQICRKTIILMMSGLFLMSAACTTIKPVYDLEDKSFASQVSAGDRVRLTYLSGRIEEINITEVSETEVKGTIHKNTRSQPRGLEVVADWRDIYTVETVKISAIKTAGAAVGVVVAIPFLALGALMAGAAGG